MADMVNRPEVCKNCHRPIERILDPWGYDNYRGVSHGYHHPELTENADGHYQTYCDRSRETEAEPQGAPEVN